MDEASHTESKGWTALWVILQLSLIVDVTGDWIAEGVGRDRQHVDKQDSCFHMGEGQKEKKGAVFNKIRAHKKKTNYHKSYLLD